MLGSKWMMRRMRSSFPSNSRAITGFPFIVKNINIGAWHT